MTFHFPIIDLAGTASERGALHGETCRALIATHLERWRAATNAEAGAPWQRVQEELLSSSRFAAAIQRWTPDLWVELQSLAKAANQPFEDILLLNLTDEQWWFQRLFKKEACTSMAYRDGQGAVWSGQNLDVTAWMHELQVVLRFEGAAGPTLMASLAGHIGMAGINAAGLSINCNTLLQLPYSLEGLPVTFVIRGTLARRSLGAAAAFLGSVSHASGQHYLLGAPDGWLGVECDATGARLVRSDSEAYAHTNHPKTAPELGSPSSLIRLAAAEAALPQRDARSAFCAKPLHRDATSSADTIGFTLFSLLWRNEPHPTALIAAGPPTKDSYRAVSLAPEQKM